MPEEPDSLVKRIFGGIRRAVLLILTIMMLMAVIFMIKLPDQVWNIIMMVYAFYFGSKGAEYVQDIKELVKENQRLYKEKEELKNKKCQEDKEGEIEEKREE